MKKEKAKIGNPRIDHAYTTSPMLQPEQTDEKVHAKENADMNAEDARRWNEEHQM